MEDDINYTVGSLADHFVGIARQLRHGADEAHSGYAIARATHLCGLSEDNLREVRSYKQRVKNHLEQVLQRIDDLEYDLDICDGHLGASFASPEILAQIERHEAPF